MPNLRTASEGDVPELLTASEVARFFRVSPFAVRTWARTGVLPAIRLSPRVIRFRRADVLAAAGLPTMSGAKAGHGQAAELGIEL